MSKKRIWINSISISYLQIRVLISRILKCPKFIKFNKSRFKVDDQFKIYIEWELLKTNQLENGKLVTIKLKVIKYNFPRKKNLPNTIMIIEIQQ